MDEREVGREVEETTDKCKGRRGRKWGWGGGQVRKMTSQNLNNRKPKTESSEGGRERVLREEKNDVSRRRWGGEGDGGGERRRKREE